MSTHVELQRADGFVAGGEAATAAMSKETPSVAVNDVEGVACMIQRAAVPPLSREIALNAANIILTSNWFKDRLNTMYDAGWNQGWDDRRDLARGVVDAEAAP